MISEFSGESVDRKIVRILARGNKSVGQLPDGVVAGQEHDAAVLKYRDIVAFRRERTVGRLDVGRILGGRRPAPR
jgi:plasmid stabilization system protein ParE